MGDVLAKAWEKIGLAAAGLRSDAVLAREEAQALIGQRADFTIGAVSSRITIDIQWRGIETAPRDGTRILLSDGDGDLHIARWLAPEAQSDDEPAWAGWAIWRDEAGAGVIVIQHPTHWSPLPPPPEPSVVAEPFTGRAHSAG